MKKNRCTREKELCVCVCVCVCVCGAGAGVGAAEERTKKYVTTSRTELSVLYRFSWCISVFVLHFLHDYACGVQGYNASSVV